MQTETESRTDAVFEVVGSPLPASLKAGSAGAPVGMGLVFQAGP